MKYTIELTEKQKKQMDLMCELFHRYVGFNPKLEMDIPIPMTVSPAYKKGFEDGKKYEDASYQRYYDKGYNNALDDVNHAIDVLKGMTVTECEEWFEDCDEIGDVVCENTIQGIIRHTKAYEERKEGEIRVGDEVKTGGGCKATVTYIYDRKVADLMFSDGSTGKRTIESLNKTGRNFGNEVEQVINKLRGKE